MKKDQYGETYCTLHELGIDSQNCLNYVNVAIGRDSIHIGSNKELGYSMFEGTSWCVQMPKKFYNPMECICKMNRRWYSRNTSMDYDTFVGKLKGYVAEYRAILSSLQTNTRTERMELY